MKDFCVKYKRALIGSLAFSFVCFGFMMTHFTLSIDEETWILSEQPSLIWLLQGRFAVWLFDLIFTEFGNFAPFLWDFMAIIFWNVSGMLFAWAFLKKEDVKEWQIFLFCAYYSSLPFVVGEIMAFSMFNLQVSIGMAATAGGFVFSRKFLESGKRKDAAAAFFLLLYGIATFQAMICVYVTAVVAYCLIRYVKEEKQGMVRIILVSAGICIAAAVIYYGINLLIGLCFGTAGYLSDNYNGWTSGDWKLAAAMAIANIGRVSFAIPYQGEYIYGGNVIRILSVLFVIYAVWLFIKRKGKREKLGVFFYTVALCVAPFTLYLALATYKTHGRMLLGLPLVGAVQMYLIYQELRPSVVKKVFLVLMGYLLFLNVRNMNMIYYYSSIVYERDCTTASQIMYDIQRAGIDYRQKPIAFVGMIQQDDLPIKESCTLGGSFFSWDDGNNSRMRDFIRTRGYKVEMAGPEGIHEALEAVETMNTWPQEGSIQELDDVIVVYLSQPTEKWYAVNGAG